MTYAEKFEEVATMLHGAEEPIYKPSDADVDKRMRYHMMCLAGWDFNAEIKHLEGIDIYIDEAKL